MQRHQWLRSLELYAFPVIGGVEIGDVTRRDIIRVLEPIWQEKHETATRVLRRVGAVMTWAIAREIREDGVNVAEPSAVKAGLPAAAVRVVHHPAMSWRDVPAFVAELLEAKTSASLCLAWVILTAVRSGEGRGLMLDEIDSSRQVWTVPAERMKGKKEKRKAHDVPFTWQMQRVLSLAVPHEGLVFPSPRSMKPLSDMGLLKLVKGKGFTVQGFRSSFADWARESGEDRDLAEHALAHAVGGVVERAYARSTLLERRRELMDRWCAHCFSAVEVDDTVVSIRGGKS